MTAEKKVKTLPENLTAEEATIAGILHNNSLLTWTNTKLTPKSFNSPLHSQIFRAIISLQEQRRPITEAELYEYAKSHENISGFSAERFVEKLSELPHNYPPPSKPMFESYVQIVVENDAKRQLIALGESWRNRLGKNESTAELIESAQRHINEIAKESTKAFTLTAKEAVSLTMDEINRSMRGQSNTITTGIPALDQVIDGFNEQELIIIAARPGIGKTALAVQLALHALTKSVPTAFYSYEMPVDKIIRRINGLVSGVPMRDQTDIQFLSPTTSGYDKINAMPLHINYTPRLKCSQLSAQLKNLQAAQNIRIAFVDYLGLIEPEKHLLDSRTQQISYITRELKVLSMELKMPIVLLSQLNREMEHRTGKFSEPQLSDLRDSGSIEQDADKIIFIHRPDAKSNLSTQYDDGKLIVAKNRNGAIGSIPIQFFRPLMKLEAV